MSSSPEVFDSNTPSQVRDSRELVECFHTQSRQYKSSTLEQFSAEFLADRTSSHINWDEDVAVRVQCATKTNRWRIVRYQHLLNQYMLSPEPEYYQFYVHPNLPVKLFFRLIVDPRYKTAGVRVIVDSFGARDPSLKDLNNWSILFRPNGANCEFFVVAKHHYLKNKLELMFWLEYVENFTRRIGDVEAIFTQGHSPCLGGRIRGEEPWTLLDSEAFNRRVVEAIPPALVTLEQFRSINLHYCQDIDHINYLDSLQIGAFRPYRLTPPAERDDEEDYLRTRQDKNFVNAKAKKAIMDVMTKFNPDCRWLSCETIAEGTYGGDHENCQEVLFVNAPNCAHGERQEEGGGKVIFTWKENAFRVCCSCKRPAVFSVDPTKQSLYDWICTTFWQLRDAQLDRPDMPIMKEEFERRCVLPSFFAFDDETFVYHPPRVGTDMYWNLDIWNILSTSMLWTGTSTERFKWLTSYLNCFIALCGKGTLAVRSEWGIDRWSRNDLKSYVEQLRYIPEEEAKKKHPKKKPFYEAWFGLDRRAFSDSRNTCFEIFDPKTMVNGDPNTMKPTTKLNLQAMRNMNVMDALNQWLNLLESDTRLADYLVRFWAIYRLFLTYHEEGDTSLQLREFIQSWFLQKGFCPGKKLQVSLYLAGDFGTGKSWFFELLTKILGLRLIVMTKDSGEFFKKRFNAEVFVDGVTLVVFDDNFVDTNDKQAAANQRAFTTSMTVTAARKNKDEFGQAANVTDFAFTTNPEGAGKIYSTRAGEHERRNCATEMANPDQQDAALKSAQYRNMTRCDYHRDNDNNLDDKWRKAENCPFCFMSVGNFWAVAQHNIKGVDYDTHGKLLYPFVGMLYHLYLQKKDEYEAQPLANTMPVTKMMRDQEKLSAGPIAKWFDECLERGYLLGIFGGKEKDWSVNDNAFFPRDFNPNQDGEPFWIEEVEWSTLKRQYQIDTGDMKSKLEYFKREIAKMSQTRGAGDLEEEDKQCIHHVLKLEGDDKIWRPTRGTVSKRVVTIEQWRPVVKGNVRSKTTNFLALFEEATRGLEDTLQGKDKGGHDMLRRSRSQHQISSSASNSPPATRTQPVSQEYNDEEEYARDGFEEARGTVLEKVARGLAKDRHDQDQLVLKMTKRLRVGNDVGIAVEQLGEGEDEEEQPRGKHGRFVEHEAEEVSSGEAEAEDALNEMELDWSH